MQKTVVTELKPMNHWRIMGPLGCSLLGLFLVALVTTTMPGCKDSSPSVESSPGPETSIKEYWQSLFKDDPESQKAFLLIQGQFRTGKRSLALQDLQSLLERSPQAPWTEAVEFYLAQAWTVLRKYGHAIRQLDALLDRYPTSPAVPRFLTSKGQIYLVMGKQRANGNAEDPVGKKYLQKAKELFQQVSKDYANNQEVGAEALFYLGDASSSLEDIAGAKEAFRKVVDAYGDTSYGSKALYSMAGQYLSEADLANAGKALKEITDRYPKTRLAGKATQKLEGLALVGSPAPPLQAKEWIGEAPPEGDIYRGKLTLLSFWAIWCPHCKRNIPKMELLLETYRTKGLSVVGVTREKEGQGADKVREFVDTHPMGFPTAMDDEGKTSKQMAVKSIPCVVAVDAQGRIRWHGHPDHLSDTVVAALLEPTS